MNQLSTDGLRRRRVSVDEYYRMAEVGLLRPDERLELIEGEIIETAPVGSRHASVVDALAERVLEVARGKAIVRVQGPIRLDDRSEPEPDLALVLRREGGYREAHPGPRDVLLLVEVAETTLRYDRFTKTPLYARHGIPEVWLIDLENECVHFHRTPRPDGYADVTATDAPGPTPVRALPGVIVDLSGILR